MRTAVSLVRTASEKPINILVGRGNSPPKVENISLKVGITLITKNPVIAIDISMIITG